MELGEISLEESDPGDYDKTVFIEDLSPDESDIGEKEDMLELGDISIEEFDSGDIDKDLKIEGQPRTDLEEAASVAKPSGKEKEGIEKGSAGDQDDAGKGSDIFTLDLENLDIDLDLDEPEDKE